MLRETREYKSSVTLRNYKILRSLDERTEAWRRSKLDSWKGRRNSGSGKEKIDGVKRRFIERWLVDNAGKEKVRKPVGRNGPGPVPEVFQQRRRPMTARNNIENQNSDLRNRFPFGKRFYDLEGAGREENTRTGVRINIEETRGRGRERRDRRATVARWKARGPARVYKGTRRVEEKAQDQERRGENWKRKVGVVG